MRWLALILTLGITGNALAFSAGGHRIIAQIAWHQLDENRRAELVELIKHHPRLQQDFISKMPDSVGNGTQEMKDHWLFLQASVWPDLARGAIPIGGRTNAAPGITSTFPRISMPAISLSSTCLA